MLRGVKRVTCPHCGHSFVAFDIEDNATAQSMPVHCPRCCAEVKADGILGFFSRLLALARKSSAMMLVFIAMIPLASCDRYEDWPRNAERMKTARAEVEATDPVFLLQELVDASKGNIAAITRMTCLTPQMISRLLDGTSKPTRLTELSIRAVAEDFYFYRKRFWIFDLRKDSKWRKPSCWLMNLPYVADPFQNFPDPRAEILNLNEDESD